MVMAVEDIPDQQESNVDVLIIGAGPAGFGDAISTVPAG